MYRCSGYSDRLWSAFVRTFGGIATVATVVLLIAAIVLDPYDTGRFALLRVPGVPEQGPRTANASRGRDPHFDSAIIGNSNVQLVSPEELTQATGFRFVSLIVPGSGPREQFAMFHYFLRTRVRPARALVLGLDDSWCTSDPALPISHPFPFWLYDPDSAVYVRGLFSLETLSKLVDRLRFVFRRRKRAQPNGYWDYEQHLAWRADSVAATLASQPAPVVQHTSDAFPALDTLSAQLARIPPDIAVALVRPPVYVTALPQAGTEAARREEACRAAMRAVAQRRARTALLDWRGDLPVSRDIENWFDRTHYRAGVARLLEADIAASLSKMR